MKLAMLENSSITVYPDSALNFVSFDSETSIQLLQTSGSKEVVKIIFPRLKIEVITKDFNNARKIFTLNNPVVETEQCRCLERTDVYSLSDDLLRLSYDKDVHTASFNYLKQTMNIVSLTRSNELNINTSELVFEEIFNKILEKRAVSFYNHDKILVDDVAKSILSDIAFRQESERQAKKEANNE